MNVTFTTDLNETVDFNNEGDVVAHYEIMNFQRDVDGSFSYIKIGDWKNHELHFSNNFRPPNASSGKFSSVCSKPCPKGSYKVIKFRSNKSLRAEFDN